MQESQQIFSFENRLNNNIEDEAIMFDKLKEDIKEEEDIAMKSALLLQLLEVGSLARFMLHKMIQHSIQYINTAITFLSIDMCEFSEILFYPFFRNQRWTAHYHLYMLKISLPKQSTMMHYILQRNVPVDIIADTLGSVRITNIERKYILLFRSLYQWIGKLLLGV